MKNNLKFKKYLIWYYMLSKRLIKKISFVMILLMIPVIVMLAKNAMVDEGSITKIALCAEDDSQVASKVIDSLMKKDTVVEYIIYDNYNDAKNAVADTTVDAAWIFKEDFDEKMDRYSARKGMEPFIEVIEREDSIPNQLSREILYGTIYKDLSYSIYKNFVFGSVAKNNELSEAEARHYYVFTDENSDIVQLEYLNSELEVSQMNYLLAPLRGILSLIVVLCSLAAAMYFLKDQSEGKFDWLSPQKRLAPAFASCLSAASLSAVAVFLAYYFAKINVSFVNEAMAMILYIISSTAFSLCLCIAFRSYGKLGASIPAIMILMIALSPIFFNLKILTPIKILLPSFYYLNSVYDAGYLVYELIYCVAMFALSFVLNRIMSRRCEKISILK